MSDPSDTNRRARPRLTDQIQVIRSLWLLREQARVQAAERCFLSDLERLLSARISSNTAPTFGTPSPTNPANISLSNQFPRQIDEQHIYESVPPPRTGNAPVRERHDHVAQELEQLLNAQRVTNLSPEFRAVLEGNSDENQSDYIQLHRRRSFGDLMDSRFVSTALDSQFRHQLESVLVRRDGAQAAQQLRRLYTYTPTRGTTTTTDENGTTTIDPLSTVTDLESTRDGLDVPMDPIDNVQHARTLRAVVRALQDEVASLKGVIGASFDLQLDIQRSIRQEVAAAMSCPPQLSISKPVGKPSSMTDDSSECTHIAEESGSSSRTEEKQMIARFDDAKTKPVKAGICTVCLENCVDSLLYACGHMCTCIMCGRQLIASGQSCPICRAPVRDVVRAFTVTE